ncbi:MAG: outer membrane lipoprotein carrier protein LolA [Rhodothermales bacterium]|nr:outer membrane lipoprotein carrier protein LolA [Rhodothermales bacterium]MBO6780693.1 outer membrane lipoprotein carrier protein LolA [Rhodothermales bacterium]
MKRPITTAFLLLIVLLTGQPSSAQSTDIVPRILERYAELETLQARFRQTMTSTLFEDETETITGSIFLRGDAYRVLTGSRTVVTDGVTSWIYDALENQVLIDNRLEDEFSFSVHQFLYDFDERFEVAGTVRDADIWRVALTPLDPDDYFRSVELIVRDRDAIITEMRIDDANEVNLHIRLSEITENPDLPASTFRFDIPEGADVVDLRADQ